MGIECLLIVLPQALYLCRDPLDHARWARPAQAVKGEGGGWSSSTTASAQSRTTKGVMAMVPSVAFIVLEQLCGADEEGSDGDMFTFGTLLCLTAATTWRSAVKFLPATLLV